MSIHGCAASHLLQQYQQQQRQRKMPYHYFVFLISMCGRHHNLLTTIFKHKAQFFLWVSCRRRFQSAAIKVFDCTSIRQKKINETIYSPFFASTIHTKSNVAGSVCCCAGHSFGKRKNQFNPSFGI